VLYLVAHAHRGAQDHAIADKETVLLALDTLSLALVEKGHTWTPEQRSLYEKAVRIVKAEIANDPLKLSMAGGRVGATA
jgi:hypothetical protein